MAYATVEQFEGRLAEPLSERERAMAAMLLEDAATIIDEYSGGFVGASAATLERVSCAMVKRAMLSETGAGSDSLVPLGMPQPFAYTSTYGNAGDLYLTRDEREALDGHGGRCAVSFARVAN